MTHIANLFRERRMTLGLSKNQVVQMTPYKNLSKGVSRLTQLEVGEWLGENKVLTWFAASLDIPMGEVLQAVDADFQQKTISLKDRKPAEECAKCGLSLNETGGSRIIASTTKGVVLRGDQIVTPGRWAAFKGIRLEEPYDGLYLILGGWDWEEDAVNRTCQQAQDGLRPWICQRCAGRVCNSCGSPVRYCHACSILKSDGRVVYAAILPIPAGCTNPDCDRFFKQ